MIKVEILSYTELHKIRDEIDKELNKFVDTTKLFVIVRKRDEKPLTIAIKKEFYPQSVGGAHWPAYEDYFTKEFINSGYEIPFPMISIPGCVATPFSEYFRKPEFVREDEIERLL